MGSFSDVEREEGIRVVEDFGVIFFALREPEDDDFTVEDVERFF